MTSPICCPPVGPGMTPRRALPCVPGTKLTPVFFLPPGEHVPIPGYVQVVTAEDCSTTVAHLDETEVDLGSLYPIVQVTYTAVAGGAVGGGGATVDREIVVTTYRATVAGVGYAVSDIITLAQVIDVAGTPTHVSAIWRNQTTGANIAAPASGHLELTGAVGLTDAQLRATPVAVEPLGQPGLPRQLAAGAASANTALTTTCRRLTMHANGAAIRFMIGTGAQVASATSHYIGSGERLDWAVPANAQIAVIRAGATDGVLEISELV